MTNWTGRSATALVERARRAGYKEGAIIDALDVTDRTLRHWSANPGTEPHGATCAALDRLVAKLDRAERRKGAGK